MSSYPIGSELISLFCVHNVIEKEKELINTFREYFIWRRDLGTEYFSGNNEEILNVFAFCMLKMINENKNES
jgi:hypothetical protein